MPLVPGNSRGVISHNIREMIRAGHPHNQAVAASLHHAKNPPRGLAPHHYGMGGNVNPFDSAPHLNIGGMPIAGQMGPPAVRREEGSIIHNSGLLKSSVPGRTDQLNKMVPAGAYVIPADVVSGIGEGNTMAGANVLQKQLSTGPHGVALPHPGGHMGPPRPPAAFKQPLATGGSVQHVPVVLAGGEYVVHPEDVKALGNGNIKKGHRILDAFVVHARKKTAKEMLKLPGPLK